MTMYLGKPWFPYRVRYTLTGALCPRFQGVLELGLSISSAALYIAMEPI